MVNNKGCRGRTSDAMAVMEMEKHEANGIGKKCQVKIDYNNRKLPSLLPEKPTHREDREATQTMSR